MRARVRKAFTLVEILIVVVILGILAAIVVPQFTNATESAQAGNIQTQLESLNSQIELHRAQTNAYPDFTLADPWTPLITGGYLKSIPKNPFNKMSAVGSTGGSAPATDGWHWGADANGVFKLGATNFDEDLGEITPGVE